MISLSAKMGFTTAWKRLSPTQLNIAIQAFSLIAIFFEGYDQGVMGGVNASPRYVTEVDIGTSNGTVTNEVKQGGIISVVSVYSRQEDNQWVSLIHAVLSWCNCRLFSGWLGC